MLNLKYFLLFFLIWVAACKSISVNQSFEKKQVKSKTNHITNLKPFISDTTFVNLKDYSKDFILDMKYASKDNFLKTKVYDCDKCFLRLKTVKALMIANQSAMKYGFKIKLFDCYRPLDVQKKMWSIVPNSNYVANPVKGSIHNKGNAVDITLVDFSGKEIDMGTEFDFFGEKASHNYQNLSDTIKNNRKLLKNIMLNATFKSFVSEWWHYNLASGLDDKVSNFKWNCD